MYVYYGIDIHYKSCQQNLPFLLQPEICRVSLAVYQPRFAFCPVYFVTCPAEVEPSQELPEFSPILLEIFRALQQPCLFQSVNELPMPEPDHILHADFLAHFEHFLVWPLADILHPGSFQPVSVKQII